MTFEVKETRELARIRAMPERVWDSSDLRRLALALTDKYKTPHGTMTLFDLQARILAEAHQAKGCYISAAVGAGKTLPTALFPHVLKAKRPLLLVPAALKDKTQRDYLALREHWQIQQPYPVLSYELIQHKHSRKILAEFRPDLIVADEAHNLRNMASARARRFLEYFQDNPDTQFCALTGSPTRLSILDYWHILIVAIKEGAPIPYDRSVAEAWGNALDSDVMIRRSPGALSTLCNGSETGDRLTKARQGFRRRMANAWGVVCTTESSSDQPIRFDLIRKVSIPGVVADAIEAVETLGETPNGDILEEQIQVWSQQRELACGFFYYWDPPPPDEWLAARRSWNQFVRLELQAAKPWDSPALVAEAFPNHPRLKAWLSVKDLYDPNLHRTERWLSTYLLEDTIRRVKSPTLVWVDQVEVGRKLSELSGWPYYGSGRQASIDLEAETGDRTVIVSIHAHSAGHNLQMYNRNLYLTIAQGSDAWEQSIGRTHRTGQTREVYTTAYTHFDFLEHSLAKAIESAKYVYDTTGQEQKLLIASMSHKPKRKREKT